MSATIQTTGLTKIYGKTKVVDGIDLDVREGEAYAFLGPNGSGKSTTISMILGLVTPTSGEVRLFGKTLSTAYYETKRRIGVVGEHQHLYEELTANEYLRFFAELYRVPNRLSRIDSVLEKVGLQRYKDLELRGYSKGMRQKLAFARALLHDPDLLVLDEPVSSLDPYGVSMIRDIILSERSRGKTIFISSHVLSEIEKTCTKVGIVDRGRLVAQDSMQGLKNRLSGGAELRIELAEAVPGAVQALKSLDFVRSVECDGKNIRLKVSGSSDPRPEVSRCIVELGGLVVSMTTAEITLEEAFIAITDASMPLLTQEAV
ncbi:MAG: ABC transporter ATP-binding protein [Bacillota bacterium]